MFRRHWKANTVSMIRIKKIKKMIYMTQEKNDEN